MLRAIRIVPPSRWNLTNHRLTFLFVYYLSDPVFNQMKTNSQALGADIQFGALSKVKLYSKKINKLQKCNEFLHLTLFTCMYVWYSQLQTRI